MMKKIFTTALCIALAVGVADAKGNIFGFLSKDKDKRAPYVRNTTNINELDQDIIDIGEDIELMRDTLGMMEKDINALKASIDSLKQELKLAEADKKTLERDIEYFAKSQEATQMRRDSLVLKQHILPVLKAKFDNEDVVNCLQHFEGVKTESIAKYKDLVEDYAKYVKSAREFLEKKRKELEKAGWTRQSSDSDFTKSFEKGLKGTKYWKTYDKRTQKPYRSIPYLDGAYDQIISLQRQGFSSKASYDALLNQLY